MYDVSVFIGRFQPFHLGHLQNVKKALDNSSKIIINIGSSFNAPNMKNPFSFEQRREMILADLKLAEVDLARVEIEPLADFYYQEERWEDNLIANVTKHSNITDKIVVVGHQKDASSYYLKSFPEWDYLSVENYKNYNATDFRKKYYKGQILSNYMVSDSDNHGSFKYLKNFMNTSVYDSVKDENDIVENDKNMWKTAPYRPIFTTVDALVIVNNCVLLIQRKNNPGKNLWALPGGFLDHGEFINAAIVRELYEETTLSLTREQIALANRGSFVFDYPSRSVRGQTITHVGLFKFDSLKVLPNIKAADDAKLARWVPIVDIKNELYDKMFEDHYQIITVLLSKLEINC